MTRSVFSRLLVFASGVMLLCLSTVPVRAEVFKVEHPEFEQGRETLAEGFREALFSEVTRRPGLYFADQGFDYRLATSLGTFSYSADLGEVALLVKAELLTPADALIMEGNIWGTSGEKPGYKGGLEPLLLEAARDAAAKVVETFHSGLQYGGLVIQVHEAGNILFEKNDPTLAEGQTISVVRNGQLMAVGTVDRMWGASAGANIQTGFKDLVRGDVVFRRDYLVRTPVEVQHEVKKKKKNKFTRVLLGLAGVGLVGVLLSESNNDDKNTVGPPGSTPAGVTLTADVMSVARLGQGQGAQKTTAALTATVLNGFNAQITSPAAFTATAGNINPTGDGKTAVVTPPGTSQIVTITAISGNASGQVQVHVGGPATRWREQNDSPAVQAPQGVNKAVTVLAYDANLQENVLAPSGTAFSAELQVAATSVKAVSTLLPFANGACGAQAANPLSVTSGADARLQFCVQRNIAEANTNLKLVLRDAGATPLTLIGGGDFLVTP